MIRFLCVGLLVVFAAGCTGDSNAVTPPGPRDPDEKLVPVTRKPMTRDSKGTESAPRERK